MIRLNRVCFDWVLCFAVTGPKFWEHQPFLAAFFFYITCVAWLYSLISLVELWILIKSRDCICNCIVSFSDTVFATWTSSTRTPSSWVCSRNPSTSSTSIVMFCLVTITTRCLLSMSRLRIMTNELDSIQIALEAILLLIYAWNSCPVLGTAISRSLVAVHREFSFPINFSAGTMRSLRLHLVPSLPILANLLSASTRVGISLNWSSPLLYWLTLSLLGAPLGLIRSKGRLINSCILSQAHGVLHAPSQVHLMSSNLHRIQNGLRRSTLLTCSHIHRN